ncbi:MAG: PTS sugar transporter subunit IIA [Deltaproteobacteria bacterium]|nr:MAG: PTS sugar transporter subunit IIA [Deltaproteobacteria bacterium]
MKIIDLLDPKRVVPSMQAANKRGVLEEMAAVLVSGHQEVTQANVVEVLLDRERLGSTGIGDNIAIPHGKVPQLSRMLLAFGRSVKGVDFDSMDGKPSHLFFVLLAPVNSTGLHLKALAKISRMLMSQVFRDSLMKSGGPEDILRLISEKDAEF